MKFGRCQNTSFFARWAWLLFTIHQGETFGLSAFLCDGDEVYRTYFTTQRGVETLGPVWSFLDVSPLGRQESWEDSPEGYPQTPTYKWWNWHDTYVPGAAPDPKWVKVSDAGEAAFRKRDG